MSAIYTTHAALYDAAFDWDVSSQVEHITRVSGIAQGRVLEPMCGPARLLRAFARAGFETVGLDLSEEMLGLAAQRYATEGLSGTWVNGDAANFSLGTDFDLAVCPVNSLAHLPTEDAMVAHLGCVAAHLRADGSYWVQLDLDAMPEQQAEEWEFEYEGETATIEWRSLGGIGPVETHVTRITLADGEVIEQRDEMKVWSFARWTAALSQSPLRLAAAYAGDTFAAIPADGSLEGRHVVWQRLIAGV